MFIKRGQHFDHVHDLFGVVHLLTEHFEDSGFFVIFLVRDVKEFFRSELVSQHFLKRGEMLQSGHILETVLVEAPHDAFCIVRSLFIHFLLR